MAETWYLWNLFGNDPVYHELSVAKVTPATLLLVSGKRIRRSYRYHYVTNDLQGLEAFRVKRAALKVESLKRELKLAEEHLSFVVSNPLKKARIPDR